MDTVMIGRNIAEARKRAGLSQEKLAEKIGVTAQAVSKWENGHNTPDLDNLFLLADATGTSYRVILGDPEEGKWLEKAGRNSSCKPEEDL